MTADGGGSGGHAVGGSFSAWETRRTLVKTCARAGLDAEDAELMRLGENAVYRLAGEPVVVRIARTVDYLADVRTEVAVARWLEEADFPAVRLAGPADQPLVVDERVVSFWELTGEDSEYGTVTELAVLLRRLHALERPSWLHLPPLQPFRKTERRIEQVSIAEGDRVFLRERLARLREQYGGLRFALPTSTIHGDANIGNHPYE